MALCDVLRQSISRSCRSLACPPTGRKSAGDSRSYCWRVIHPHSSGHGYRTIWQETWPIIFKENVIGYFSICEYEGAITSENRQLVERCLDILALTIYHHQSYIDSTAWHTGEVFLQALLAENYQKEVVSYFAQMMGFDEQKNMSAIVISPISKAQKEQLNSKNWSKYHYFTEYAIHSIQSFIAQKNFKVILGGYYGFLVVFVDTGSKGIRDMKQIGMSIWESLTGRKNENGCCDGDWMHRQGNPLLP